MTRLPTNRIATMTELREPRNVCDRAGGEPVAVMKNSKLVAYFMPAGAVADPGAHRFATLDEIMASFGKRRAVNQR